MTAYPLPKKKPAVFHHPIGFELYDGLAMDLHAVTYAEPMLQEIERLRAENEALRADAARYRWLRTQHNINLPIAQVGWKRGSDPDNEWVNLIDAADLDKHIDAATCAAERR